MRGEANPNLPQARRIRDDHDDEEDEPPRLRSRGTRRRLPRTEGVFPRSQVRMTCFGILTFTLIVSGALAILAVWEAASSYTAWRAVTSLAIVAFMTIAFTVLNEVFGRRIEPGED